MIRKHFGQQAPTAFTLSLSLSLDQVTAKLLRSSAHVAQCASGVRLVLYGMYHVLHDISVVPFGVVDIEW